MPQETRVDRTSKELNEFVTWELQVSVWNRWRLFPRTWLEISPREAFHLKPSKVTVVLFETFPINFHRFKWSRRDSIKFNNTLLLLLRSGAVWKMQQIGGFHEIMNIHLAANWKTSQNKYCRWKSDHTLTSSQKNEFETLLTNALTPKFRSLFIIVNFKHFREICERAICFVISRKFHVPLIELPSIKYFQSSSQKLLNNPRAADTKIPPDTFDSIKSIKLILQLNV